MEKGGDAIDSDVCSSENENVNDEAEEVEEEVQSEEDLCEEESGEEGSCEEEPYDKSDAASCEEEPSLEQCEGEPCDKEPSEPGEPSEVGGDTIQSKLEKKSLSVGSLSGPNERAGSSGINPLEASQNVLNNVIASEKLDNAKDSSRKRRSRWDDAAGSNEAADADIDAAKQKRKSRWSAASLSQSEVDICVEVARLQAQLYDINKRLEAVNKLSLPPSHGNFMNTSSAEDKLLAQLMLKRLEIISELIQKDPNYIPPPDYKSRMGLTKSKKSRKSKKKRPKWLKSPKLSKKIYIPSKEYPDYNFVGLVLGPRGNTHKRMEKETGAKICLRGKGCVLLDKSIENMPDQTEDLHVLVEACDQGSLDAAVAMVEKLLIPVEPERNVHKMAQLRELATLKGCLRGKDSINTMKNQCDVCGDASHPTSACPLTASDLGSGTNEHGVNFLAELRGAFSPFTAQKIPNSDVPAAAHTNSSRGHPKKEIDYTKLFVGCLPHSVDDGKLVELFSRFGQICHTKVVRDKTTGLHRGYGFVKYLDRNSAAMAVAQMNGYKIDGKMLTVGTAGILSPPDKPTTKSGGLLGLNQLPPYPGYAAIARSNPGPTCWPGPPGSMLPEDNVSFIKNDSRSLYHSTIPAQSSMSLGFYGQPPAPSILLSRDSAASDKVAHFPGYLKSLDPPSQLHQPLHATQLPSTQVHSTPGFRYPYYTPPP